MMKSIIFFILFCSVPTLANTPKIINSSALRTIDFGERMEKYITTNHKDLKVLNFNQFSPKVRKHFKTMRRQLPMADVGDYNGDSKKDAIVLGRENNSFKLLAILSDKKGFTTTTIQTWSPKEFKTVFTDKDGIVRYISSLNRKYISNKNFNKDVFQLETYMGFTELLYFENGKFKVNKGKVVLKP